MIHLIITSANISEAYEQRKSQYIDSIESCLKYIDMFDSYKVLECVSENEDYLKQYDTYYSKLGNPYENKGLNEMNHLRAYLMQSPFDDTDAIIKISGRYLLKNSRFFENVINLYTKYESIFKSDIDVHEGNGYHTFLYYMRKKLFINAIDNLEFSATNNRPIEWDIKKFIKTSGNNFEIEQLGVIAYQGTFSEMIFHC